MRHECTKLQQAFDVGVTQLHHLRADATVIECIQRPKDSTTATAAFLHYNRLIRIASSLNLGREHSLFAVTVGPKELVPFLVTHQQ